MQAMRRTCFFGLTISGLLIGSGCSNSEKLPTAAVRSKRPEPKPAEPAPPAESQPVPASAAETPAGIPIEPAAADAAADGAPADELGQIDPAELLMPKVLLTQGHAKTCRVGVGDAMPAIMLRDLAGKDQSLAQLMGPKMTVVLFWTSSNPYAVAELADMEADVVRRYGRQGVKVIAIDERDSPDQVRQTGQKLDVKFPLLLDPDGAALKQLATGKLPRTYLLDSSGKILWFDIEYSRSTWRDLRRALQFVLAQG